MHAGFLDMFHDGGDVNLATIAQRVDIDFNRGSKISIQQNR